LAGFTRPTKGGAKADRLKAGGFNPAMENKVRMASLLLAAASSQYAHAGTCTQNNNSLTGLVGLDNAGGTIYATTSSTNNECLCSNVRFLPSNTDTKAVLSILLSAKMADKKVRIDLLAQGDCNSAYRIYIQ